MHQRYALGAAIPAVRAKVDMSVQLSHKVVQTVLIGVHLISLTVVARDCRIHGSESDSMRQKLIPNAPLSLACRLLLCIGYVARMRVILRGIERCDTREA